MGSDMQPAQILTDFESRPSIETKSVVLSSVQVVCTACVSRVSEVERATRHDRLVCLRAFPLQAESESELLLPSAISRNLCPTDMNVSGGGRARMNHISRSRPLLARLSRGRSGSGSGTRNRPSEITLVSPRPVSSWDKKRFRGCTECPLKALS